MLQEYIYSSQSLISLTNIPDGTLPATLRLY